jgi:hypothetical protein
MLIPAQGPEHALLLAFPPLSPPPICGRFCSRLPRYYTAVRLLSSTASSLLDFLSWPAITVATTGGMRSPRFRRVPFVRVTDEVVWIARRLYLRAGQNKEGQCQRAHVRLGTQLGRKFRVVSPVPVQPRKKMLDRVQLPEAASGSASARVEPRRRPVESTCPPSARQIWCTSLPGPGICCFGRDGGACADAAKTGGAPDRGTPRRRPCRTSLPHGRGVKKRCLATHLASLCANSNRVPRQEVVVAGRPWVWRPFPAGALIGRRSTLISRISSDASASLHSSSHRCTSHTANHICQLWGIHLTGVRDLHPRPSASVGAWRRSIAPVYAQLRLLRLNGYPRSAAVMHP